MSFIRAIYAMPMTTRQNYATAFASGGKCRCGLNKDAQNYVLHPLFLYLLTIAYPGDWNAQESSLIGRLLVIIVRTGAGGAPTCAHYIREYRR